MKYTPEQIQAMRQGHSIEECGMVLPLDDNHVRLKYIGRGQTLAVVRCIDIRTGHVKAYCGLIGGRGDTNGLRGLMGSGQKTDDIETLGAWINGGTSA